MSEGTAATPLHELMRRFIENVKAHPGEIESDEHSITTPIAWDGLGHSIHPLATFKKIADKLEQDAEELRKLRAMKARAEVELQHYSHGKAYLERREVASLLQRILEGNGEQGGER